MLPSSISSLPFPGCRGMGVRGLSEAPRDQEEGALLQGEQPQFPHVDQNKQFPVRPARRKCLEALVGVGRKRW